MSAPQPYIAELGLRQGSPFPPLPPPPPWAQPAGRFMSICPGQIHIHHPGNRVSFSWLFDYLFASSLLFLGWSESLPFPGPSAQPACLLSPHRCPLPLTWPHLTNPFPAQVHACAVFPRLLQVPALPAPLLVLTHLCVFPLLPPRSVSYRFLQGGEMCIFNSPVLCITSDTQV